ncbi:MAG: MFS transporter [Chloroflexi bacterium]|nr:MFS transporter [Chloroflexota bacterium]
MSANASSRRSRSSARTEQPRGAASRACYARRGPLTRADRGAASLAGRRARGRGGFLSEERAAGAREAQDADALRSRERPGTWDSLRIRNFRYLWLGQAGHAAGIWMEQIARPFLVLDLTDGSATHVGGVLAVRTVPQFILGMWAGVIADSFDRRSVLLVVKTGTLLLNIAFVAILVLGLLDLWHMYAYAIVRGTMMAFDQPARMGLVPSVVPATHVTNAVALMSATQNTMRIFGAASGGVLYGVFGATGAFALITLVYAVPVFSTYMLRVAPVLSGVRRSASGLTGGLLEGVRFTFSHPAIRGVLLLSMIYFMFGMSFLQVFAPLFAEKVFDIGSTGFGGMTALMGVAALVASLFIATRQPTRLGVILPLMATVFGAALVLLSLTSYIPGPAGLVIPFAMLTVLGGLQSSYMALTRSALLLTAPPRMHGRVFGVLTLDRAFMTAGGAAAGFLSDGIGVQPAQIAFGLILIVGGLAIYALAGEFRRSRAGARYEVPEEDEDATPQASRADAAGVAADR